MIAVPPSALGRSGQTVNETLNLLIKRPWDPANFSYTQQRSVSGDISFDIYEYNLSLTCLLNTL